MIESDLSLDLYIFGNPCPRCGLGDLCKYEMSQQNIVGLKVSSRFIGAISFLHVLQLCALMCVLCYLFIFVSCHRQYNQYFMMDNVKKRSYFNGSTNATNNEQSQRKISWTTFFKECSNFFLDQKVHCRDLLQSQRDKVISISLLLQFCVSCNKWLRTCTIQIKNNEKKKLIQM